MQVRNSHAPRGMDMGPSAANMGTAVRGTIAVNAPTRGPTVDDPADEQRRDRRRETWRTAQQRRRDRLVERRSNPVTDVPQIQEEVRIARIRTSISVPEDVDAWVRWLADREGTSFSTVYVTAIRRWAVDVEKMLAEEDAPLTASG